jgi:Rps23 Pro-64 3,4-dihydroxylase Tpa1-like proline 4-hydroxylase
MTDREMLDHFSDVLISDPRLLSLQERELLSNLLQLTHRINGDNTVAETIARAVGETVAARMHEALGTSILQRLAEEGPVSTNGAQFPPRPPSPGPPSPGLGRDLTQAQMQSMPPRPPSPGPPSPGVGLNLAETRTQSSPPRPPSPGPPSPGAGLNLTEARIQSSPLRPPSPGPPSPGAGLNLSEARMQSSPPRPPSPGPPSPGAGLNLTEAPIQSSPPRPPSPGPPSPGAGFATATAAYSESVLVAEPAEILPAHCVILEEFLPPQELERLIQDTLLRESEFHVSEVVSPGVNGGGTDFEHRRSRVLLDIGRHGAALATSVKACLPRILSKLGHDTFPVSRVEAQITASNDGDFFRWHNDNAHEEVASREITFVYFFHREPKKFHGGELRIYDSRWQDGYVPTENYRNIVPRQNQLVVFPKLSGTRNHLGKLPIAGVCR